MGYPALGFASQLGIGAAAPVTTRFEFNDENIQCIRSFIETEGIRGSRSRIGENVVPGTRVVDGSFKTKPTPALLTALLPYIMGGTGSAGTTGTQYTLTDALPSFVIQKDLVTKVMTYTGCVVSKATFRGRKGEEVELEVEIAGVDESVGNAGTFPALTISTEQPFAFFASASGVTLEGIGSRLIDDFEIVIDHMLDKERFFNNQTRTAIPPQDRNVTFKATVPFSVDEVNLYNMALPGAAASVVFTNGSAGMTFNMAALQVPSKTPVVPGKKEITMLLEGNVRKLGSTLELVVESTT